MHEILIGILIVVIVAIQVYVFKITLEKIKIFTKVLPSQNNFKTVKVFIKESEIETVSLIDIFKNHQKFSLNEGESKKTDELSIFNDNLLNNNEEEIEPTENDEDVDQFEGVFSRLIYLYNRKRKSAIENK